MSRNYQARKRDRETERERDSAPDTVAVIESQTKCEITHATEYAP